MNTEKVTRFEVINHAPCGECKGDGRVLTATDSAAGQSIAFNKECPACHGGGIPGRTVYVHDKNLKFELQLQDDDRTLKLFISERSQNE